MWQKNMSMPRTFSSFIAIILFCIYQLTQQSAWYNSAISPSKFYLGVLNWFHAMLATTTIKAMFPYTFPYTISTYFLVWKLSYLALNKGRLRLSKEVLDDLYNKGLQSSTLLCFDHLTFSPFPIHSQTFFALQLFVM